MEKWTKISSRAIHENKFLKLKENSYHLPDGRIVPNYFVVGFPDWANVVAVTKNKKLLLVRQYRAAADVITLEIPGGQVDPGEDVRAAALREFREETGYKALQSGDLKCHFPNPATQDNKVHSLYVAECERAGEPEPDEHESFELVELSKSELQAAIERGELRSSIILGAIFLFWNQLQADLCD